jgi:uncharacterized protein YigE (DUF2233 family)
VSSLFDVNTFPYAFAVAEISVDILAVRFSLTICSVYFFLWDMEMKRFGKMVLFLCALTVSFVATHCISSSQCAFAQQPALTAATTSLSYGDFLKQACPQDLTGEESFHCERTIGKGAQFITEFHKEGPLFFNWISVDLTAPGIALEAEKARDTLYAGERVQEIAERESYDGHYVIAAVNGDFWTTKYRPTGLFVDEGRIFNSPAANRSLFLVSASGEPFIGRFDFCTTFSTPRGSVPIDAINFIGKGKEIVLFTPAAGEMPPDAPDRSETILNMEGDEFLPNRTYGSTVVAVGQPPGLTPLAPTRWILSASQKQKAWLEENLKAGDKVTIRASLAGVTERIAFVIGGGPQLLRNGVIDIDEKRESVAKSFVTTRHPRTAIGYSRDKRTLFLVTVDGRQPLVSIGLDLYRLAEYMKALGAYDAMNLDGGGSTTMWVRGAVVNKPSDITGPRIVTNALLVVTRSKRGKPAHIDILPRFLDVPVDTSLQFSLFGTDDNYNPIPLAKDSVRWYASAAIGSISSDGLLHAAEKPGEGSMMVRAVSSRAFGAVPVRVDRVARVEIDPSPLLLREGESVRLRSRAFDAANNRMLVSSDMIRLNVPPQLLWHPEDSSIRGIDKGKGEFSISIANASQSVPFSVGIFDTRLIQGFDRLPEGGEKSWLSGQGYDVNSTHLAVNRDEKREGEASLQLTYKMNPGGLTSISLNLNALIPDTPVRLGLWVYGDGKGHWLRGEAKDSDGELFVLDFTEGSKGIFWDKEWRYLEIDRSKIVPDSKNPAAHLDFPLTLLDLALSQSQEAKKSDGRILLDAFEAIYFPSN